MALHTVLVKTKSQATQSSFMFSGQVWEASGFVLLKNPSDNMQHNDERAISSTHLII